MNSSEEFILTLLSYNEVGGHESITINKDIPLTTKYHLLQSRNTKKNFIAKYDQEFSPKIYLILCPKLVDTQIK